MASGETLLLALFASIAASPLFVGHFLEGTEWLRNETTLLPPAIKNLSELSTWIFLARLALLAFAARKVYRFLFKPLYIIKNLSECGYLQQSEKPMSAEAWSSQMIRRRRRGDVPPVYPNGWFCVLCSHQLERGESKSVTILGMQLAAFRGEDGVAYVLDAYCPHLGANLGFGGIVSGNCIQCPFHGWRFRGDDGKCVEIPYAEKVPEVAKTKSWPVVEMNGMIFIWYHAEKVEPQWMPDEMEEITRGEWKRSGMTEQTINCHVEEMPENAADIPHLDHLHRPIVFAGTDLKEMHTKKWEFLQHHWDAVWAPCEDPSEKHCSLLRIKTIVECWGRVVPYISIDFRAKQIGPGIVHMPFILPFGLGRGVIIQSLTPVEPMLQHVNQLVFTEKKVPTFIGKFILWVEFCQVERDLTVWNNKSYASKPLLVKEDHLITKHRRWFSQFYSENSPRFSSERTSLDW
eukprot:m.2291 g.2291  ORF g.2291 m.2291 type:complete len:461 (+) comp8548_c0_seq2:35-1417(+)